MGIKFKAYSLLSRLLPINKNWAEFQYWRFKKAGSDVLSNDHFMFYYTEHFEIDRDYYKDKNILDIGCGPRGSLEWVDGAGNRIGLDPLALKYRSLGTGSQKMEYMNAVSENIPFKSNSFDVVTSFNSLDHVDDLNKTVKEIKRILKTKGYFLLITEFNHPVFVCEPQELMWDIEELFKPEFDILKINRYKRGAGGIYSNIIKSICLKNSELKNTQGIISAKFRKITY
ncbi:MAG: class I SAM-dependent methyltransferase [bacterium]|nr:class I SAM-dependent methyltransferase [bacterium]